MAALVLCKARWGLSLAAGFWTMMAAHLRATSLRACRKAADTNEASRVAPKKTVGDGQLTKR